MPTGQGVTKVAGSDSLRWDWLPATPRCSTIPCITSGGGGSVGSRGRGDGRGGRAGGAGGRRRALCGAGAALSRSLRALRVAHARLPGRRRGCGAGRAGAGVRSAGGLPGAGQGCGGAVPDFAEPLLRGAATPAAAGKAARFDGRDVCGARPAGRRVRASGARTRIGAGAAAPDPGAARGLRAEAHGRIGVRGDRRGHGRDGGLAQDADASRVRPAAGADEGASMMASYHPLVKRLLDGEVSLAELPPELQAEGEEALRLVGAADSAPVALSPALEERVMAAPGGRRVGAAGTFNRWDRGAAPLVPAGTSGVWTTTLALPVGQHQYAFVVDGARWVVDPAAPAVDDGFGRRNSVVAVTAQGALL